MFANALLSMGQQAPLDHNYFQLSPRIGYDFPTYNNNTPYIDYKGGLVLGFSLDYYWKWFGVGGDFDYIKNKPESTYPSIVNSTGETVLTDLSEAKISRIFYGIGPNFQYRHPSSKFKTELNVRFGIASLKGGRTLLTESGTTDFLNFHAGYNNKNLPTVKSQVRFTYFITNKFGLNIGAYYMRHFDVEESNETSVSAGYQPFLKKDGEFYAEGAAMQRVEPCDCDISSIGVFLGITYKLNKKEKPCVTCDEVPKPNICDVTITARDKFTGQVLANTDVFLTDLKNNIIQEGVTNSSGVVVFNDVIEDDYLIKGKLHDVNLQEETITKLEFESCEKDNVAIEKEIQYTDENFILKGNVVESTTDDVLQGVDVLLKDKIGALQKNSISDVDGHFIFHLKQDSVYVLNGKKDGYFSNEIETSTSSYDRNNTLFIDVEMSINPCGIIIELENINFDLNKAIILPSAKPDLDFIVKLMVDNPSITVEMSAHTDSQGSNDYNKDLSQRRAEAAVNYIVSKGISASRLIARGVGESELKNKKCANNIPCTEEEHRINRRVEFKIVCF